MLAGDGSAVLSDLREALARRAHDYDRSGDWPAESLAAAIAAGCWRWVIPREFGGEGLAALDILLRYEAVASGCLTTALILTQRDAAADLIAGGENAALKHELLPDLARGIRMSTVGIAQLTTSKRGPGPAVRAQSDGDGFRVDGTIPWVTGAAKADVIVIGAVLPDGAQILAAVDTQQPGVTVHPPLELLALNASWTTSVRCENLWVGPERIIRGPAPRVLSGRAPVRPLVVSVTGIGHARALLDLLDQRAEPTGEALASVRRSMQEAFRSVRNRLLAVADRLSDPEFEIPSDEIRVAVNDLVVRLALALLTISKGSGFVRGDPAQRLVREALFFLVWSAPQPVQFGTLAALACPTIEHAPADRESGRAP